MSKKKIVSLMLALGMIVGLVGGTDTIWATSTGTTKTQSGYATTDSPGSVYETTTSTTATGKIGTEDATISIDAQTTGNARRIKYSVTIEAGPMSFHYNYGQEWNPSTHSYGGVSGDTGSNDPAGWLDSDLNGTNNIITITNDSNWPVKASLKFAWPSTGSAFNNNPSGTGAVVGKFSRTSNSLVHDKAEGYGGTFITNGSTYTSGASTITATSADEVVDKITDEPLDVDTSSLATGDQYGKLSTTPSYGNEESFFFGLSGTPDAGKTVTSGTGTITVTLNPATLSEATLETK